MSRTWRRKVVERFADSMLIVMAVIALVPLSLVLAYTVTNGLPAVSHLEFFINSERPVGIPGAGVANALVGTLIMTGMASVMSIPVGVLTAVYLTEYVHGRWPAWVRMASDVLVATPSIAIGLFVYAILVAPFHHFSGLSGSVALAILMLPVVIRASEAALALVPGSLREAGIALGLRRWRVSLQLILPAAAPGVITGCLLAFARAAGETAPLLFTALGNHSFSVDPTQHMGALSLLIFTDALTPYPSYQEQAWGAALMVVVIVLLINLTSRFIFRRQLKLAGSL